MAIVTLFFCGTSSSHMDAGGSVRGYENGELISRLGLRCSGEAGVTKFTIDGPGSGNLQEDWKIRGKTYHGTLQGIASGTGWDENVMFAIDVLLGRVSRELISPPTNARWVADRESSSCSGCRKQLGGIIRSGKHHCRLCGLIFCDTCTKYLLSIKDPLSSDGRLRGDHHGQRVCKTCYEYRFREYHFEQDKVRAAGITRINCIGWSRGGVTTHMFANACDDEPLLKGKELRLIAVDPVPGGSEMSTHRVAIKNPALKEYVAFFARDERSRAFSPTLPQISAGTCPLKIYFFPGNHSSLVGYSAGDRILYNSSVLVRHIAETHLRDWGTRFEKAMQLSDDEILRYYDQLLRCRPQFEKLQAMSILGGGTRFGPTQGGGRTMMVPGPPGGSNAAWIKLQELDLDAKDECFVNWHHMDVASRRFPRCVELINKLPVIPSAVREEIEVLKVHKLCPNLAAQVERRLRAAAPHSPPLR